MNDKQLTKIENFINSIENDAVISDSQAYILSDIGGDSLYANYQNGGNCINSIAESCNSNGGDCQNYNRVCSKSSNVGNCINSELKPPTGFNVQIPCEKKP